MSSNTDLLSAFYKDLNFIDNNEEENPYEIGQWLEGDSLAPPCQADVNVVSSIIDFAAPSSSCVLYDLGW